MNSTMQVLLPQASSLMGTGRWCHLLAERIANTSSLEWTMRLQRSVLDSNIPRARFDSGIPVARHQIGAGGSPWFSSADVATWLCGMSYVVSHEESEPAASEIGETTAVDEAAVMVPAARAWPLKSGEVALAFADLREWSQEVWSENLGDPPAWLADARVTRGQRGVAVATWDPLLIANALVMRKEVTVRTMRARFQTESLLQPWLPRWAEHEATAFPGR